MINLQSEQRIKRYRAAKYNKLLIYSFKLSLNKVYLKDKEKWEINELIGYLYNNYTYNKYSYNKDPLHLVFIVFQHFNFKMDIFYNIMNIYIKNIYNFYTLDIYNLLEIKKNYSLSLDDFKKIVTEKVVLQGGLFITMEDKIFNEHISYKFYNQIVL